MSSSTPDIRTRLLIISDTHGRRPFDAAIHPEEAQRYGFSRPLPKADVAIHCGDLTTRSDVKEYQVTFDVMREIDAPLKLVIPGNHDCSMDVDFWEKTYARKSRYLPPETLDRLRQQPQETYAVVEKARQDGVHVLVAEGTYQFVLANGARLTVYASPWTPRYGDWGFQYDPDANIGIEGGHNFQIEEGTDVAMTHGPPYSILDMTRRGAEDAGCRGLLAAVRKARPRVHCFGHIHEAYGAMLMPWENEGEKMMLEWNGMDEMKMEWEGGGADRAEIVPLSLCPQDRETLGAVPGKHTLFVNAAIMDVHYRPLQSPWLVDLELPPPDAEHEVKAEQTKNVLSTPTTVGNFSW